MNPTASDITDLLDRWCRGDNAAFEKMYRILEPSLKSIVRRHVLGVGNEDLTRPTAVLQEVLLRLCSRIERVRSETEPGSECDPLWEHRSQFVSHVVMTARSVRMDALRKHFAQKHGSGTVHLSIQEGDVADRAGFRMVIAQVALDQLKAREPEMHKAFELKKFLDFTWEMIADTLRVSVWKARQYVEKAEQALRETMTATPPETAFQFIRNLDQEE